MAIEIPGRSRNILDRFLPSVPCIGAEIGVFRGENAEALLQERPALQLLCIDPWRNYPDNCGTFVDRAAKITEWEPLQQEATRRLSPFCDRVSIYKMTSLEASRTIEDCSLDFVFIDAIHESPWVDLDIEIWRRKVRPGGWLGGHDYNNSRQPDVTRAVTVAAVAYGWNVETGYDHTWFVRL